MSFKRVFTDAPWEEKVGYCRVLKAGNHIYVTGTAPVEDGKPYSPGNGYLQAQKCLLKLRPMPLSARYESNEK